MKSIGEANLDFYASLSMCATGKKYYEQRNTSKIKNFGLLVVKALFMFTSVVLVIKTTKNKT